MKRGEKQRSHEIRFDELNKCGTGKFRGGVEAPGGGPGLDVGVRPACRQVLRRRREERGEWEGG